MADDVPLTDLEVITRFSLAVRSPRAPRSELIAALQADLDWLRSGAPPAAGRAASDRRPTVPESPAAQQPPPRRPAPRVRVARRRPGA